MFFDRLSYLLLFFLCLVMSYGGRNALTRDRLRGVGTACCLPMVLLINEINCKLSKLDMIYIATVTLFDINFH